MTRRSDIAELVSPAPNGVEGEGIWRLLLPTGLVLDTVIVQPTSGDGKERWIARGYSRELEAHLGGVGFDALDAVLGILEDYEHRVKNGRSSPMVARTGDPRIQRLHRADQRDIDNDAKFRGPAAPAPTSKRPRAPRGGVDPIALARAAAERAQKKRTP